jgi:hypothetical protein
LEAAVAFFFEVYWFCHGGVVTALSARRAEGNAQIWSASRGSAFPSGAVRQCQVVAPGLRFKGWRGAGDTVRMREAVEQRWKFKARTEVEDQGDRGGRIRSSLSLWEQMVVGEKLGALDRLWVPPRYHPATASGSGQVGLQMCPICQIREDSRSRIGATGTRWTPDIVRCCPSANFHQRYSKALQQEDSSRHTSRQCLYRFLRFHPRMSHEPFDR